MQNGVFDIGGSSDDLERLTQEYGGQAITEMQTKKNEAQYVLLTAEDIDNDELIDLLERTPAYKRKPAEKSAIRDTRAKAAQRAQEKASIEASRPAQRKPTTGTIDFEAIS